MITEFVVPGLGMFVKSDSFEEVEAELIKEPLKIGRTLLIPGEYFDLDGLFNLRAPLYVGYALSSSGKSKIMYFYNGQDDSGLFENHHYFETIYWITETRIFRSLVERGGRDNHFINGIWDWEKITKNNKKENL